MFITYREIEEGEAARRRRAANPEPEPNPADVPYFRPGKPRPEQLARYWQRRALSAEAALKVLRVQEQLRQRRKER